MHLCFEQILMEAGGIYHNGNSFFILEDVYGEKQIAVFGMQAQATAYLVQDAAQSSGHL